MVYGTVYSDWLGSVNVHYEERLSLKENIQNAVQP